MQFSGNPFRVALSPERWKSVRYRYPGETVGRLIERLCMIVTRYIFRMNRANVAMPFHAGGGKRGPTSKG